ncbi:hypothetical protein RMCBS344292_04316 [Rhizopus microsporus]|nr:hypothetical protein RMCBS344292_04316 [Rhizopus microsporus]
MTMFEKLAGFAIKAKDNALSKAILSKDKRLEQSISENIRVEDILLKKVSTYGLPSTVSVIAYDCVAGLLAVGELNENYIKVFGRGISASIDLPSTAGVKYLQFKIGSPLLVAIDKANTIFTVDLRTKKVCHVVSAEAIITSLAYCVGTDWLFIGYSNGFVDVFDIQQGVITEYQIPDLLPEEEEQQNHVIVDLQLHPTDLNLLLIGYESIVHIWDIRDRSIRKSYTLRKLDVDYKNGNLTCLAWSPNGTRFIGGYDDGYTHLWDINSDKRPIASRRLFQHYTASSEVEPIYQIAWYTDKVEKKSFVIVAGGAHPADTLGLNLLEFDYDGESKEPKKQTIMPLASDLSHFLILSTNPYYGGIQNPFGIAIVGSDHSFKIYGLDHGFPQLKLPPALEFVDPCILTACYLPQLPDSAYTLLSSMASSDRRTRYAPITGGIAGPEHVYHIQSNDLLLTIHQGELIKFWDASYTALRPLPHLTIECTRDLGTREAIICCLDVNKSTGALAVGFSNGSIIIYEYVAERQEEETTATSTEHLSRQEELINQCDTTLKEISDLLEDMGSVDENDLHADDSHNPFILNEQQMSDQHPIDNNNNNPFVESAPPPPDTTQKEPIKDKQATQPSIFQKIDVSDNVCGYHAALHIRLDVAVRSVTSIGDSLIAAALDNGSVVFLDIYRHAVLFSENIVLWDVQQQNSTIEKNAATEVSEEPSVDQSTLTEITYLGFFNTYSSSKAEPQLFICLGNGHIYQFSILLLLSSVSIDDIRQHLCIKASPPLLNMHVIDLKGTLQVTISDKIIEEEEDIVSRSDIITKEHSPVSHEISDDTSSSQKAASTISTGSSGLSLSNISSKRIAALGKAEYRQQDNPHFIICVSAHAVNVYLAGFNVKLYSREFKEFSIVQSEIVQNYTSSSCLSLVCGHGKLLCFSLPKIEPIAELTLPEKTLPKKLIEASLSQDGRVVLWTGQYEIEQYQFMENPSRHVGESVILHDAQKELPPHPSTVLKRQKSITKKSWLNAVAGAFQKEPLTIRELDTIMGRVHKEDAYEATKKKIEAYKAKNTNKSSSGPSGVFAELGDKMNERGERLNELNQKFEEMNAASGDFLKAVKEYNERQARKKWWEF